MAYGAPSCFAGEIPGTYLVTELINEEDLLTIANQITRQKLAKGEAITDKYLAQKALQAILQTMEREVFVALFLDNQHRLLAYEELFWSTLGAATVHPREVLKSALKHNSAAVLLAHNHPSGYAEPSSADLQITEQLKGVLQLVEIRLLDHVIITAHTCVSLAERGCC